MEQAGLVDVANENFVASHRTIVAHCSGGAVREEDGVAAFSSGLPISFFNSCLVLSSAAAADVGSALDWLAGLGVPYRAWTAPELAAGLHDVFSAHGLEPAEPYPAMVLHPVPPSPPLAEGIEVVRVDEDGLDEFLAVIVDFGLPPELAHALYSPSFANDPHVQLFLARADGVVAGTSVAIQSPRASGVYAVGTLPAARRRGVGAALTWAAVAAGVERGHEAIVLQSSPMGFSLYAAMGFETVLAYAAFAAPRPVLHG